MNDEAGCTDAEDEDEDWEAARRQQQEEEAYRRELLWQLTDLTNPAAWYPAARAMKRTIVAHMGPTNSGGCRCIAACMTLLALL